MQSRVLALHLPDPYVSSHLHRCKKNTAPIQQEEPAFKLDLFEERAERAELEEFHLERSTGWRYSGFNFASMSCHDLRSMIPLPLTPF